MYLSPETILFIREHRNDDVHSLALQAKRYPQVDMPLPDGKLPFLKYQVGMQQKDFYIRAIYH